MNNVKTFIRALHTLTHDAKKAKAFLNDKRLSLAEKTILQAHLDLRDCKNDATINALIDLR